jgi:hypothetical protein
MSLLPNLDEMTDNEKMAVLESIQKSISQSKEIQKQKIAANVDLVVQALKKIEFDIRSRFDDVGNSIEKRVASIQDGRDGADGKDGRDGKDGKNGRDGAKGDRGERGQDGRDGVDGVDGVSVSNARIDFDGSLIITLSTGVELNVGEVVSPDLAESIKVITNGGGTSQYVLDTLASLQTQITNLIPSQTGNSGKFLTTDGTDISWASVAGGLSYQGTWNATTNTPTLTSSVGVNGYYYIVSTAGSTNLDGITDWQIGDWLLFNGSVWQKIDQSNLVTSVNGQTGAVSVGTVTSVAATAGTGITVTGSPITSSGTLTITNSAPDQTVALTGAGTTSISGTYPNFTITSNDAYVGTVTSVGITAGTGITVSNSPITSSGSMTVGVSTKLANFVNLSGSGLIAQNGSGALDAVTITGGTGISVAHGNGTSGNPTISLASGYGDTLNPYTSKTANYFLAAPNGSAGVPTFRAIVAADIPTLNQDTTGSAATVTTTINSGVVATTQSAGDNSTKVATTAYVNAVTGTGGITGFKNRIINGAMVIDQRNAGAEVNPAVANTYHLDRWLVGSTVASKFKIGQNAGAVTPPTGYKNYLGCTSLSAYAAGASESFNIQQRIEGFNIADLAWGTASAATVTLSFQVYSSLTGTFGGSLRNSGTSRSYPFSYSISVANTWTQISITIAGDTSGTWLTTSGIGIYVTFSIGTGATLSGTAGSWAAANYVSATGATSVVGASGATFYITGVQLEKGSTATSFDYRPYGTELALCQRYFERSYNIGVTTGTALAAGIFGFNTPLATASDIPAKIVFKVTKRNNPTMSVYNAVSGASGTAYRTSDANAITVNSLNYIGNNGVGMVTLASGSVNNYLIHWIASSEL